MDKIILKNMKFYGYHGVHPEEQEKGQNFFIDAELLMDLQKAGRSDSLEDTVSYPEIYDIIKNITEGKKFKLIESLAESISEAILFKYKAVKGTVIRVRKPEAPIDGVLDWPGVELVRMRNE